MNTHEILEYIKTKKDLALKEFQKSEIGCVTTHEAEEAEEDIFDNYYEDDSDFIFEKMGDITEHYIEQQEFVYYQAFIDCIEILNDFPELLTNSDLKESLCKMRV